MIENFSTIMLNDRMYANVRYNEVLDCAEIHTVKDGKLTISRWTDADEAHSMQYIESNYGIYSKDRHTAAMRILFKERSYNPIRDIVDAVQWDGVKRCDEYLVKWGKAEDSAYSREVL